jgi:hypothetical protein
MLSIDTLTSSPAFVAVPIPNFISSKMVESMVAPVRQRASVPVANVEAIVDVSAKACRAMKPPAGADKGATDEPFRSVVTIGRAGIGGVVIVTVRAYGFDPDADANFCPFDFWSGRNEASCRNSCSDGKIQSTHDEASSVGLDWYEW